MYWDIRWSALKRSAPWSRVIITVRHGALPPTRTLGVFCSPLFLSSCQLRNFSDLMKWPNRRSGPTNSEKQKRSLSSFCLFLTFHHFSTSFALFPPLLLSLSTSFPSFPVRSFSRPFICVVFVWYVCVCLCVCVCVCTRVYTCVRVHVHVSERVGGRGSAPSLLTSSSSIWLNQSESGVSVAGQYLRNASRSSHSLASTLNVP